MTSFTSVWSDEVSGRVYWNPMTQWRLVAYPAFSLGNQHPRCCRISANNVMHPFLVKILIDFVGSLTCGCKNMTRYFHHPASFSVGIQGLRVADWWPHICVKPRRLAVLELGEVLASCDLIFNLAQCCTNTSVLYVLCCKDHIKLQYNYCMQSTFKLHLIWQQKHIAIVSIIVPCYITNRQIHPKCLESRLLTSPMYKVSGQIITTSHDLTPKGS